jgi:EmrB/QacA subfamily drug resistance transporter
MARTRTVTLLMVPLMLVLFISNLDATVVATALPSIGRDLHDTAGAPWVATAYLLTSAVTTLIFGKLGDMHGRKRIFQVSIVVFLAGSVLAGLAGSMLWLVLFRALQGIGGGGLNSLVMAIIGDVIPARQRSRYQSLLGIVATVALIAGPLLGGLFSQDLSWRWIFYINVPVGLVALVTVAAFLHLPKPTANAGRVDVLGGILAAAFTTAIMLVTSWGGHDRPWDSAPILVLIATVVMTLIAYVIRERKAAEPITPLHLFRSSVFNIASAQFLIATLVLFVAMLYVPAFLQTVQHKSAFVAGLYVIPLLLGLVAATAVAGPVIARTGRYKIYPVVGAVLTGVSMWLISLAGQHTGPVALIVPLIFAGAGIGLFVQVALLAGQNAVDHRHLGAATGALNFFKSIGGAFGAALFGAILAGGDDFHAVFGWTVPFMALSLVLGLIMREKPLSAEMIEVAEGKVEVPEY